ncbi:MAG: hypothetical protein O3C36_01140 [archaeon]|nr:hypothetical protein [archaeon]
MRDLPYRALLMMTLILMSSMAASASPPSNGDSTTVQTNEAWTEDTRMDGHVTVESGNTLTVSANITMATGSSITVEDGGQLVLTNGALLSENLNAGLRVEVNSFVPAVLTLNFGDIAESGVVQLKLNHVVADGVKVNFTYGETTVNASGSDTVEFDVPLNGTDLEISVETAYFTPTYVLWAKAIHSGGDTMTIPAQDISASEAPLYWFQSGFDLHAHGDLTVTSSTILGGNISCAAICSFDGTSLTGSAPIHAASTSTVSVLNSIISGSRTDEDIVLHDEAGITYTNSQGTGGTTDAWVRILSQRTLSTNIPNGSLDIYNIGYNANDWNDLTDANGDIVLVGPGETNENKRMVAWMDGNGVVHEEEATITLSISSSWGTFSKTIDAPTTSTGTIELDLPFITVTAVAPETTVGVANKSVSGTVTVENTGSAAASGVNVWCYEGEDIADTTQMVVSLGAGESKEIPFTWYVYTSGEATLTCKPLLPTALDGIAGAVHDDAGAASEPVTWSYEEEVEEFPLIILIVALVGFGGLALYISAQSKKTPEDFSKPMDERPSVEDEEKDQ